MPLSSTSKSVPQQSLWTLWKKENLRLREELPKIWQRHQVSRVSLSAGFARKMDKMVKSLNQSTRCFLQKTRSTPPLPKSFHLREISQIRFVKKASSRSMISSPSFYTTWSIKTSMRLEVQASSLYSARWLDFTAPNWSIWARLSHLRTFQGMMESLGIKVLSQVLKTSSAACKVWLTILD